MFTLISTLIGLLGSSIPGLLNFLTTRQNNSYQLDVIRLQMQAAAQGTQLQIDLANTKADIEQQQLLYSYDNGPSGSKFIDALKSSVRPVITYVFFVIWVMIEFIGFFYAIHQDKTITEIIPIIWDQTTSAIFATILGFWFGSRMLEKYAIFPLINQPVVKDIKK